MVLKKIFLTGGSGTLGKEMIKNQLKHNINFVAPSSKECDITNYDSLYKHIHESGCSEVIHSAAATNVTDIEKDATQACDVNVIGTFNIIKVCQQLNKKMVFISTDYIFDGQKGDNANFRESGQLRQILLLVDNDNKIVAEAPLRGFKGGLDSLGKVTCK